MSDDTVRLMISSSGQSNSIITPLLAANVASQVRAYLRLVRIDPDKRRHQALSVDEQREWHSLPAWLTEAWITPDERRQRDDHLDALVSYFQAPLPPPPPGLTKRQKDLLRVLAEHHTEKGCSPPYRWLTGKLGVASTHTIHGHVRALIAKGCLRRSGRSALTLLVDPL